MGETDITERMRAAGIVQRHGLRTDSADEPDALRRPARPLPLPGHESLGRRIVADLMAALERVRLLHTFGKGLGLAAPQIGLSWAVAVVVPAEDPAGPVILLNPRTVAHSADSDEQYEGCLSFFEVRGLVRRPLAIDVSHDGWDGRRLVTSFEQATARLVAHEIDHLEGRLYTDLMPPDRPLVPVGQYGDAGRPWRY